MKFALVLLVAASLQVSQSRPAEESDALSDVYEILKREMELPAHFDKRFVQDIFRAASCLPIVGALAGGILSGIGLMPKDDTCNNDQRGRVRPDRPDGGDWAQVDGSEYGRGSRPDDGSDYGTEKVYRDRSINLAPSDYVRIVREVIENNQEKREEELTSSDFIRMVREVMTEDEALFDKRQTLADLPVVGKVFNALSEIPIAGDLFKGIMTGIGLMQ